MLMPLLFPAITRLMVLCRRLHRIELTYGLLLVLYAYYCNQICRLIFGYVPQNLASGEPLDLTDVT